MTTIVFPLRQRRCGGGLASVKQHIVLSNLMGSVRAGQGSRSPLTPSRCSSASKGSLTASRSSATASITAGKEPAHLPLGAGVDEIDPTRSSNATEQGLSSPAGQEAAILATRPDPSTPTCRPGPAENERRAGPTPSPGRGRGTRHRGRGSERCTEARGRRAAASPTASSPRRGPPRSAPRRATDRRRSASGGSAPRSATSAGAAPTAARARPRANAGRSCPRTRTAGGVLHRRQRQRQRQRQVGVVAAVGRGELAGTRDLRRPLVVVLQAPRLRPPTTPWPRARGWHPE